MSTLEGTQLDILYFECNVHLDDYKVPSFGQHGICKKQSILITGNVNPRLRITASHMS